MLLYFYILYGCETWSVFVKDEYTLRVRFDDLEENNKELRYAPQW
jgi:hypothetical protein